MEADLSAVSLKTALTPGWLFGVRASPVIEQIKVCLQAGLHPSRIHAALNAAKARGVSDAVLNAARKTLPAAYPPSPPPPLPAPVLSPPPPSPSPSPVASSPPPDVAKKKGGKRKQKQKKAKQRLQGKRKKEKKKRKKAAAKEDDGDDDDDEPDEAESARL